MLIAALFLVFGATVNALPCSQDVSGSFFDFSSLKGNELTYTAQASAYYSYTLNMCGSVEDICAGKDSMICQATTITKVFEATIISSSDTPPCTWALADASNPQSGVTITCSNGQTCNGNVRKAQIQATCDNTATSPTSFSVVENPQCTYTIKFNSAAACPTTPPAKSGLSGGSIFLIILFVVGSIYGFGGCLYKKFKMGAEGTEIIPNIDFWMTLPTLVIAGVMTTKGCLLGLCGKKTGSDSATEKYEEL